MKKFILSAIVVILTAVASVLFIKVIRTEGMVDLLGNAPAEALTGGESPYPYFCYQSMGYCPGSGAGLSWKCIMTTSGDRCVQWYCKDCD